MIPRIIHYCWFGGELSPLGKACLDTWVDKNPDYIIMLWDESNLPPKNDYIEYAIKTEQWAFLSDYVRLWAVYNYGGFYCDTDIEAVKSFDFLTNRQRVFSGWESDDYINFSFFGAPKEDPLVDRALKCIVSNFEETGGFLAIPKILTGVFVSEEKLDSRIEIYPRDYFYPYNPYIKNSLKLMLYRDITENTVVIHHWDSSWVKQSFYKRFRKTVRRFYFYMKAKL